MQLVAKAVLAIARQVELVESPNNLLEGTRVIVTFLGTKTINLTFHGIAKAQAEILRASLATFA